MLRRVMVSALSAFVFTQVHASTESTPTSPIYPLVGAYLNTGNFNYASSSYTATIAKFNMAILMSWPNFSASGKTMEEVIQGIKKLNPNEPVFIYEDINELQPSVEAVWSPLLSAINSNHWWLYEYGSSGSIVGSQYGNGYQEINTTTVYPAGSGQHYVDWRANWEVNTFYKTTPSMDGFFTDNVFWKPRVNGDWQQNGTNDNQSSTTVETWYRQGFQRYTNDLKAAMPGKYQLANTADWGKPVSVITEYNQLFQGGVMEGIIGPSWSFESQDGWKGMYAAYQKMMNAIAKPQMLIFDQWGSTGDWQGMRYGLATCLLGNAYYFFDANSNSNGPEWFDEYNANLGTPTSNPFPSAPYQKGVYRRDFSNGIALVNPKGNGKQTITLETSYHKLSGSQDPSVNNGETVTSVTLNDRDGIILLRTTSQTVPEAPVLSVQ
jgi:hypothetical protein